MIVNYDKTREKLAGIPYDKVFYADTPMRFSCYQSRMLYKCNRHTENVFFFFYFFFFLFCLFVRFKVNK